MCGIVYYLYMTIGKNFYLLEDQFLRRLNLISPQVFYGQDPLDSSGFDEILEVHRLTGSNSDYQITILSPSIEKYDNFQQNFIKEIECTNMNSCISLYTIKKSNKISLEYI